MSNQPVDTVFDALGEPVRRRILELLREGPTPVGRLAEHLPVGRPAVSKHLRVLEGAGLIEHRGVGTRNLYALAPGGIGVAQSWLAKTWDMVLAAYAAEVGRAGPRTEHAQGASVRRGKPSVRRERSGR
jgi:DNA-binding transcriptional ArsR family regulator